MCFQAGGGERLSIVGVEGGAREHGLGPEDEVGPGVALARHG